MLVLAIAIDRAMAFTPWLLCSMMSPALEKRLGVDRVWPLYLITGQKKNIRVYQCSYQRLSAVKKREKREEREERDGREERVRGRRKPV